MVISWIDSMENTGIDMYISTGVVTKEMHGAPFFMKVFILGWFYFCVNIKCLLHVHVDIWINDFCLLVNFYQNDRKKFVRSQKYNYQTKYAV